MDSTIKGRFLMPKRILICDDEEGIRESLKLILSKDYELVFAEDGVQCLDQLKNQNNINLVVLDIRMPKINGVEVLKFINEKYSKLPVIIVSGFKSHEIENEGKRLGAQVYIEKPFKREDILAKVKKLLQKG